MSDDEFDDEFDDADVFAIENVENFENFENVKSSKMDVAHSVEHDHGDVLRSVERNVEKNVKNIKNVKMDGIATSSHSVEQDHGDVLSGVENVQETSHNVVFKSSKMDVENVEERKDVLIKNETREHVDDKDDEFDNEFDDDVLSSMIEDVESNFQKKRKSETSLSTVHKKRKSNTTTKAQLQDVLIQYYGYVIIFHKLRFFEFHQKLTYRRTGTQIFERDNTKRSKLS